MSISGFRPLEHESLFQSRAPVRKLHDSLGDTGFHFRGADSMLNFTRGGDAMDTQKLLPAMNNLFGGMY